MDKIFTISLLLLIGNGLFAQDTRFAQYEYTPQLTNPATIASDDFMVAYINHRTENIDADLTYRATSVFGKYPFFNKQGRRFLAVGIGFDSDNSEGLGDLNRYGFSSTIAYNHYVGDTWAISGGVGAAYSRREFSMDNFTTGSQWVNNVGFVPDVSNGEAFQNLNTSYLTVNGGFEVYQPDQNGDKKHYLGVSAFHVNEPNQSLLDGEEPKPLRFSVQAGVRAYEGDRFIVGPEVIFNDQAENNMLGVGANLAYLLADRNPYSPIKSGSINLKIRNIIDQAIILGIQLNQPNFSVGFSYDLGVSSDTRNPEANATEFAFAVKKRLSGKSKKPVKTVKNYSINNIKEFYRKEEVINENDGTSTQKVADADNASQNNQEGDLQFELRREFSFGFNETVLDSEDKQYLDDLANLIKLNPQLTLKVVGHADNIGTENANKRISLLRAKAVEEYLISQGIDKRRIKTEGKGSKEPLAPNDTEANRAKNRRVEFVIYKK